MNDFIFAEQFNNQPIQSQSSTATEQATTREPLIERNSMSTPLDRNSPIGQQN